MARFNRLGVEVFLLTALIVTASYSARPFMTDDAGAVTHEAFELEAGADFNADESDGGIGIKHGITRCMDIGFGFGYLRTPEQAHTFTDAELGRNFGLLPDLLAATATGCFGNRQFNINLIASRAFSMVSVNANLGMSAVSDGNDADLTYALCANREMGRFSAGIEFAGTQKALDRWQIGGNVSLFDWLTLDAGVNGAFEGDINLVGTAGLTFAFPVTTNNDTKKE
ncbi:MAG: hypothetical protein V1913_05360 [Fibrobacterota bacterium]